MTLQMDREQFKEQMRAEWELLMEEMADAMDNAPAERIIRDSEEKVLRRKAFCKSEAGRGYGDQKRGSVQGWRRHGR